MTNRQRKKFEPIRDLLRCPCCGGDMRIETGSLRCAAGHCFDIASKGYVNLTLAQKSLKGYDSNFFENRREVMEQGLYRHVLDGILSYLRSHPLLRRILDVGCGEGYYAKSIAAEMRDSRAETAGRNPAGRSSERAEDSPSELLQKRSLLSQTAPSSPWTYPKMPSNAPHGEETTSAGWSPIFPGFH
ncbi:MAG: hypothetical protein V8Q39_05055 [Anaerovoracaceae bacterium]